MIVTKALTILAAAASSSTIAAFTPNSYLLTTQPSTKLPSSSSIHVATNTPTTSTPTPTPAWFVPVTTKKDETASIEKLKAQVLQLGASLDRGQAFNPTSGNYYSGTMAVARRRIDDLLEYADPEVNIPKTLEDIEGEWELVLTTVPHGLFRSSPFFLAVQYAFRYGEQTVGVAPKDKANLFFKLHELQTCSWGASKVGRIAQRINPRTKYLYSEFDTSLFSLTVIPVLGWFKLLPTFGGCVITAATCEMNEGGRLDMEVDYTTSRPVPGLSGLGKWIWDVKVPVGDVWKLLPWNKGRAATCGVTVKFVDEDFRIVEDDDGEMFVYTRPVVPRPLDLY